MIFPFFMIILSMAVIDGLWLFVMVKRFYAPQIGYLMNESIVVLPAIIFYLLYAVALNVFVVLPGLKNHTGYLSLFLLGLLFGMVTYGTYDLTNQITLKNWPWIVTVVDIAWGSLLIGGVSVISTFIVRYWRQ
jgi:uncharacterized membrane protein